jgi:hypothetical protein
MIVNAARKSACATKTAVTVLVNVCTYLGGYAQAPIFLKRQIVPASLTSSEFG